MEGTNTCLFKSFFYLNSACFGDMESPRPDDPPRVIGDLTTSQMRHLLLAKLPPAAGVHCWGADRAALIAIAENHGVHGLSKEDVEEVGPAELALENRIRGRAGAGRARSVRRANSAANGLYKMYAQVFIATIAVLLHGGSFTVVASAKQWLGLAPPLPPPCPPPTWWQRTMPWAQTPGADGECTVARS